MNLKKAKEIARKWVEQKTSPKELNPVDVENVLTALGFVVKEKNHAHTTYRWIHNCLLEKPEIFPASTLRVSIGHSEGKKSVVRIFSVKMIILALECHPEVKNEKL